MKFCLRSYTIYYLAEKNVEIFYEKWKTLDDADNDFNKKRVGVSQ